MIDLGKYTDPYERKARLYPALLCLLPIMVATAIAFPSVFSTLSGLVALAASVGILHFLTHISRGLGKALEAGLYQDWNGIPSVVILRYRDTTIPTPAKRRYHAILSERTGIRGPTQAMEDAHPDQCDEIYRSWSDFLRGATRDTKKYSLLFKENINYGFRRNLFGLKQTCIICGIVALALILLPSLFSKNLTTSITAGAIVISVYIAVLSIIVNPTWVRAAAHAYAIQLIETINVTH